MIWSENNIWPKSIKSIILLLLKRYKLRLEVSIHSVSFDRKLPWAEADGGDRESGPPSSWKITSGYRFPWLYWYGPLEKRLDPLCPMASRGRSVGPVYNMLMAKKTLSGPRPLAEFSGSAHGNINSIYHLCVLT